MKNINKSAIILLAGSAVLSLFAAGKAAAPVVSGNGTTAVSSVTDKDLLNVVNRTVVGRQELVEKAEKLIRQANAEFQKGNFMDACKIYIKAKQEFKKYNSSFFAAKTAFCDRSISRCYNEQAMKDMLEAEKLAEINDFDSAIKLCKNAIKYCPERAEQLESRIDFYTKRKAAHNFEKSTSIDTVKPQHASQEYQIELLLEQGREFVSRGEYQKAIRKFNDVLLIDPYNDDANQNLLGCYNRLKKFGLQRTYNTRHRLLSEAAWKFSAPILPESDDTVQRNLLGEKGRQKVKTALSELETKLNTIKIPNLILEEESIEGAINTIRQMAKTNDKDKKGVNIVFLKSRGPENAAAQNNANAGNAEEGANANANNQPDAGEEKTISIKLVNRTVMEALNEICKKAKLSEPRIEHDIVVLSDQEIPAVGLTVKTFRYEIPDYTDPESLKKRFSTEMGVPFPKGSELYYHPNIATLVVRNTRRNCDLLHKVLERHFSASESTPMVQVRFKVLEINQNDLNELAFNWFYGVNTKGHNDSYTSDSSLRMKKNNQLMNFFVGEEKDVTANNAKTLGLRWEKNSTGTFVDVALYALNQADSADVLYSPQVTTLAGMPATVSMTTERTFPEDWEIIESEYSQNLQIESTTFPNLDKKETLGMNFTVKPEIIHGADGPLIRILADFVSNPIKTFDSWYEYDARIITPPDPNNPEDSSEEDGEYYKMPIFNERAFKTLVTMKDGETVLLTGMTIDTNDIVHDKIPILGDIPFIGRFFQSRYTEASKTNFLVFATCRLVKPDGTPLYPKSVIPHGEFNFGRSF